jgi:hypothetical protein
MESEYKEILNELIEFGLKEGSCVLFVGPELIKINSKDYNEAFYETLPEKAGEKEMDKMKIRYDYDEKIWHFSSSTIRALFNKEFTKYLKKNIKTNHPLFRKLASIPFPLIVSLIPDNTLERAFSNYDNFNFTFKSHSIDSDVPVPSVNNLLIYNIFGNIKNRKYALSHFDYLQFIRDYESKGFPTRFSSAIKRANYFVFIGFEFDIWYNIFLFYILHEIKKEADKYSTNEQSAKELYEKLSGEDLKLVFLDKKSEKFIDDLYERAKDILRKIVLKEEYLMETIKANQTTIEKIKERRNVTSSPMEQRNLDLDIEALEKDNGELFKQLENLNK